MVEAVWSESTDALLEELNRVNELLGTVTPYKLGLLPPSEFLAAPVNAHHMRKNKFDQLVRNVKEDGNLSSLPLCWHDREGRAHLLSGHHRIEAAQAAGITYVLYLYQTETAEEKRTAIQLSHNELFGEDDLSILKQQWEVLKSLDMKLYSGLDDERFQVFQPVELASFTEKDLLLKKVELTFVPAEEAKLQEALAKVAKSNYMQLVGIDTQYGPFLDALMKVKAQERIYSNASVFLLMTRLAEVYCALADATAEAEWPYPWDVIGQTLIAEGLRNDPAHTKHTKPKDKAARKKKAAPASNGAVNYYSNA
jgi:ParB-like nuclease domain